MNIIGRARLGLSRAFGMLPTPEGRPALEVLTVDHKVIINIWKHSPTLAGGVHSEVFYKVELPAGTAERLAECLGKAAKHASRIGDSPMEARVLPKTHKESA